MSATGLLWLTEQMTRGGFSAYYDFEYSTDTTEVIGDNVNDGYTGVFLNSSLAQYPARHSGIHLGIEGSNEGDIRTSLTGATVGDKLDLTYGNLSIDFDGLNAKSFSAFIDFEFKGEVHDGILFGCLSSGQETVNGNTINFSSGFNVGVTNRGHLFCQTIGLYGDSIRVLNGVELSKRNLIGISASRRFIDIGYFDFFNDVVSKIEVPIDEKYISNEGHFVIGGSNYYFRSQDETTPTFSGYLNHLAFLSGYRPLTYMKDVAESVLSTYEYTAEVQTAYERITGYNEQVHYRTGITGYEYISTGTLTIQTGREESVGSISLTSSESISEGEKYYKYYTFSNGLSESFYKEELGHLNDSSGYLYYPTGEGAYDTLGLNDISSSIQTYAETTGVERRGSINTGSIVIDLYGKRLLTGFLNEISGVSITTGIETYYEVTPPSSGLIFSGDSTSLKKDYIYYLGERSEL